MRKFSQITFVAFGIVWFVSEAAAQQCNLNRKTISFMVTVCSQQGCKPGAERIDIVGEHVVHYSNAAVRAGTVYSLGRTTDLCTDETNAALWAPRCSKVDDVVKATATATYAGGELRLSVEQSFYKRRLNNLLYARTVDLMRFEIISCEACRMIDYTLTGFDQNGAHPLLTFGGSNGCQISELQQ